MRIIPGNITPQPSHLYVLSLGHSLAMLGVNFVSVQPNAWVVTNDEPYVLCVAPILSPRYDFLFGQNLHRGKGLTLVADGLHQSWKHRQAALTIGKIETKGTRLSKKQESEVCSPC